MCESNHYWEHYGFCNRMVWRVCLTMATLRILCQYKKKEEQHGKTGWVAHTERLCLEHKLDKAIEPILGRFGQSWQKAKIEGFSMGWICQVLKWWIAGLHFLTAWMRYSNPKKVETFLQDVVDDAFPIFSTENDLFAFSCYNLIHFLYSATSLAIIAKMSWTSRPFQPKGWWGTHKCFCG